MDILFATGNDGKLKEISRILTPPQYKIVSLSGVGISVDINENGETFRENALIKANETARAAKRVLDIFDASRPGKPGSYIIMADDSGLEIDYLNKQPGVHSARFMGHETSYKEKNETILEMMKNALPCNRAARFVCAIAAVWHDGGSICSKTAVASLEGSIAYEPRGQNGFGYDPIFFVPEYDMTVAEMNESLKNAISHRAKALSVMKKLLEVFSEDRL